MVGPRAAVPLPSAPCSFGSDRVSTRRVEVASERARSDRWCATVGPPLVATHPPRNGDVHRLLVVSWNIHVGAGRVRALVASLKAQSRVPEEHLGFILLLQEAVRTGDTVPHMIPNGVSVPRGIRPRRPDGDVVALARDLEFSVAYVPSMRNGQSAPNGEREDRGAAILSSEPISEVLAVELPFGRQRRVAVLATVDPRGSGAPILVASAHFDVLGGAGRQADHLGAVISAMQRPTVPVILGIDTNAVLGARSHPVEAIDRVVPRLAQCGSARTTRWLARVDFLFSNLPSSSIATCETLPHRHGSDHAPIVMTITL